MVNLKKENCLLNETIKQIIYNTLEDKEELQEELQDIIKRIKKFYKEGNKKLILHINKLATLVLLCDTDFTECCIKVFNKDKFYNININAIEKNNIYGNIEKLQK